MAQEVGAGEEARYERERERMVREQIAGRDVRDRGVLEAMRRVPRHLFVPPESRADAYDDQPLPIGYGQTISQPYIVAYMTQLLDLKPGMKALEVGTGSGYQAAILAQLIDEVYTIEIIEALGREAAGRLKKLGHQDVRVKIGDGYFGWPEHGPFDAIVVTAAANHIPPPLLQQLKPGGRMAIPVGGPFQVQTLMLITKSPDGKVRTRSLMPVRFVPLVGQGSSRP
ncbi:MAG: protein-L-isoaspartate(D-aspartate) O-methyltransferase [Acidobacteria bacterium]|nr:protein-L-isoaspartate(D-aspartate) O-methyltransferase [Acidobacteriota bacterium]